MKDRHPHLNKIKIYHANNRIFAEQHFRSSIENANHNITFCGVGSHHQNAIVEMKSQTLTLVARTLFLCVKIYWPEAVIKML